MTSKVTIRLPGDAGKVVKGRLSEPVPQQFAQLDDIIGSRHRRDLGDIDGLAASMDELGCLQPIVVKPDGTLIAGGLKIPGPSGKTLVWSAVEVARLVAQRFAERDASSPESEEGASAATAKRPFDSSGPLAADHDDHEQRAWYQPTGS
jgi:hypothetical protein